MRLSVFDVTIVDISIPPVRILVVRKTRPLQDARVNPQRLEGVRRSTRPVDLPILSVSVFHVPQRICIQRIIQAVRPDALVSTPERLLAGKEKVGGPPFLDYRMYKFFNEAEEFYNRKTNIR